MILRREAEVYERYQRLRERREAFDRDGADSCKWAVWMNIRLWDMSKGPELEKQGRKEEACEIAVKVSQDVYDQTLKEWVYDR